MKELQELLQDKMTMGTFYFLCGFAALGFLASVLVMK